MPSFIPRLASAFAAGFALVLFAAAPIHAAQIAEWNFDDGTPDDLFGTYDLNAVGGGPTISAGTALFDGDEGSPSFLETTGYGGSPDWSIALRIRSETPFDQGGWQGIFSNNDASTADYSWQVENFDGRYQFRTTGDVYDIGAPTGGWDSIVIRKTGGNDGDIWFNGVQVVSSFGSNPGGLQNFRLGTNRNTNRFYAFEADFVRVYDSFEDPALIPEPSTALLLALGLVGLASRRSRVA
ncbi:MAG: PEP-CTERM sorting domain-containing protein [Myxococcota bacterium]